MKCRTILIILLLGLSCKKEDQKETALSNAPVVTTAEISSIKTTSAVCGGTVSSDGGFPVTSRGVCWNTSPNPTVANNKSSDGNGTGNFISNLSSLKASTNYYVRAFAVNSKGTGYGDSKEFNTPSPSPGSVAITINWDIKRYCGANTWWPCWDVLAGLGYSQSDIDKEAFFNHKDLSDPGTYTATNLTPGTYYYKIKKTIRTNCYFSGDQFCDKPQPVIKSGSFTISSNKETKITVSI